MPMLRQFYAQYNENYAHAMESFEKCKKNKEFVLFLEVPSFFLRSRFLYCFSTTNQHNPQSHESASKWLIFFVTIKEKGQFSEFPVSSHSAHDCVLLATEGTFVCCFHHHHYLITVCHNEFNVNSQTQPPPKDMTALTAEDDPEYHSMKEGFFCWPSSHGVCLGTVCSVAKQYFTLTHSLWFG